MTQPYIDTEQDRHDRDHGPANLCAMCGATKVPLVWGVCRTDDGARVSYSTGYRCAEGCRTRREQPKEETS